MCFIGPCAAKKLEASRRHVRSDVDFVLTFEELAGVMEARGIDYASLPAEEEELHYGSAAGRGFAQSGGVAKRCGRQDPRVVSDPRGQDRLGPGPGQSARSCLMMAKAGKYNGYLLEGMGCPGGCIGGAGTIADPNRTAVQLNKYVSSAPFTDPEQSAFINNIHLLKDDPNFE